MVALIGAVVALAVYPQVVPAQNSGVEPQAEKILRRMSDYLASRQQFSFTTENTIEAVLTSGQKIQFDNPATGIVSRPNKMRAHRKGDLANQEFFYDGKSLTLYSPKEKFYATAAAPATLEEMLDFAREKLDVFAPAAEFLYKNAADKMLKEASSGFVVGQSVIGGVKCTQLAFRGAEVDWQVWIEDGARPLPRKFILTSKKIASEPQMTVLVKSWDMAPKVADGEFSFTPPKDVKKIDFLKLTSGSAQGK
ncbi:MAG TPA: DUF2092 domain-containing protein [Candidatus Binatia bacterium]|jgi:hypothetical protein